MRWSRFEIPESIPEGAKYNPAELKGRPLLAGFYIRGKLAITFEDELRLQREQRERDRHAQIAQLKDERNMWREKWKGGLPSEAITAEDIRIGADRDLWQEFLLSRNQPIS